MIRARLSCVILVLLSFTLVTGCQGSKQPQEVAQNFWSAMKVQDINTARKYSTVATRDFIDLSEKLFHDANVTFGRIIIDDNKTTVETTIQANKNGAETTIPFQTILIKEDSTWKVDYEETRKTIKDEASFKNEVSFSEMINGLNELGRELSRNMDETLSKLKQKIPEIEKKVEKYGENTSKEITEYWQRRMPEIKKSIEELGKSLGKEIQDTWQQHMPEIKKGIEEFVQVLEDALENVDKDNQQEESETN